MRTPYCRARAASPPHLLHLLHSQSNHEIWPCPPAFPALHQECGRLTSTERVADSKPSFLLEIVDRDARQSVRVAFPTSCLMRRASSSPRSYSLLDES